jgi:hypothetical protein
MEPISLFRSWMWDLHQIGCTVSPATAREAERILRVAYAAGAPAGASLALARDVVRRGRPYGRSVHPDLERVGVVHVDRGAL